jgi:hypothetical protein
MVCHGCQVLQLFHVFEYNPQVLHVSSSLHLHDKIDVTTWHLVFGLPKEVIVMGKLELGVVFELHDTIHSSCAIVN